jgi:hypothetical protein
VGLPTNSIVFLGFLFSFLPGKVDTVSARRFTNGLKSRYL